MKTFQKMLSVTLSALLTVGSLCTTVGADEPNTPKEEIVYATLNGDGSVKDITVVNAFTLSQDGAIIDYGDYAAVRNMTTTDAIRKTGDKVAIDAAAGRLYYEGTLPDAPLPWTIALRYELDGRPLSAEELAGADGHLTIRLSVTRNEACGGSFYDGCALQISLALDAAKCRNIVSDGATVANVGGDKQLSYILLPGRDADITIDADVTAFEMDGIALNGVRLDLALSVDDASLQERIDKLVRAVSSLDEGAEDLRDGASAVYDATDALQTGATRLHDGAGQLAAGASALSSGLAALDTQGGALTDGAYAAFTGLCDASAAALNASLTANGLPSVTLTPESYAAVLDDLLAQTDADAVYARAREEARARVTAAVEAQADELYAAYIRQNADAIVEAYIRSQADALYTTIAEQAVAQQLAAAGMTDEQIAAYCRSAEGQALIQRTAAAMTDEQKQQTLAAAAAALTDEQRVQILTAAQDSLTDEQKAALRDAYTEQQMSGDEVTAAVRAAVEQVSAAAGQIAELKGRLDQYAVFYRGVQDYTAAVTRAAAGATALDDGLTDLFAGADTLNTGVGALRDALQTLADGTSALSDGTGTLRREVTRLPDEVSAEIDALLDDATGRAVSIGSFVSEKNTAVNAVQFVIKTAAVHVTEAEQPAPTTAETLTFWQKLLRLFGLY